MQCCLVYTFSKIKLAIEGCTDTWYTQPNKGTPPPCLYKMLIFFRVNFKLFRNLAFSGLMVQKQKTQVSWRRAEAQNWKHWSIQWWPTSVRALLYERSQASPTYPSGKSDTSIQMCTELRWKYTDRANRSAGRKLGPSATLSTSYEWTELGSNPVLRGNRSANNSDSHDRASKRFKGVSCGVATDYPKGWTSKTLVDGGRTGH